MPSNDPNYQKNYIRKHYQENKEYYKQKSAARKASMSHEQKLFENLRTKSRTHNIPFTITVEDIVIPQTCPVFGTTLVRDGEDRDAWPSVDRFVPSLGYVPGNIMVISYRANRIKNDATLAELKDIVKWLEQHIVE
jgi:hypothetical protein